MKAPPTDYELVDDLPSPEPWQRTIDGCLFVRDNANLTSIVSPEIVGYSYVCVFNDKLASLAGGPQQVDKDFSCSNNDRLTSLSGGPQQVGQNVYINLSGITSLVGAPRRVGGYFLCSRMPQLVSMDGVPEHIGDRLILMGTGINSLHNIHERLKFVRSIDIANSPLKSHILGLMLIEGLQSVSIHTVRGCTKLTSILNRHLPSTGIDSLLDAQEELIEAGFAAFAQL